MQLVFKFAGFPALDKLLDSLIVDLISWLETEGIVKDEPYIHG